MKSARNLYLKPLVMGWLVLTVISLAARVWTFQRMSKSVDIVLVASLANVTTQKLLLTLQDAETGQRGYLLTGEEAYLEPFRRALVQLPICFREISEQLQNNALISQDLLDIRAGAELKMAELQRSIDVRRHDGFEAALLMVKSGEGKQIMDHIQSLADSLKALHLAAAGAAGVLHSGALRWSEWTANISAVFGLGMAYFALKLIRMRGVQELREDKLIGEKEHAENLDREKSTFLANMSHEIRTPMNAILGFSELLAPDMISDRHKSYVAAINTAGTSLLGLINDILDISKVEAGMVTLHPEPLSMQEVSAFLHTVFAEQAARRGLHLEINVDATLPRALMLDRLRLRQVLINLVGNALKFTKVGSVTVHIHAEGGLIEGKMIHLVIEVIDTGVGIPPERQQEVFKPFVQGVDSDSAAGGTGLGLSIVQRLTKLMGGSVELLSSERGSTFRVHLPAVNISSRLPTPEAARDMRSVDFNEFITQQILIVDDNAVNRQLLAGMFEGTHHQIRFAVNGAEALTAIANLRPDLVLMDIRMPVMDGPEALGRLRKMPGHELIPVIAVTASSLAEQELDLRNQFNGYLRKPFSQAELYHEMAKFVLLCRPIDAVPTAVAVQEPAQLAETLQNLEREVWPQLRDSPALMETQQFATKLTELATTHRSERLAAYASALLKAAQTFSFSEIEISLAAFPEIVSSHQMERGIELHLTTQATMP